MTEQTFEWTEKREAVAVALAAGYTQRQAATRAGVARATVQRWEKIPAFSDEVDRLAHMVGIAARAERLKEANRLYRVARKAIKNIDPARITIRDILDILKYAQSETDGAKLNLVDLLADFRKKTRPE